MGFGCESWNTPMMSGPDPPQFYSGLVADLYAPLRAAGRPDPGPYLSAVRRYGEPALELGCGVGDPLLDLIAAGLEVEGLDSSADMLERCRANAARRGLSPTLHLATMQAMDLGRRFRCVYIAGPTFNLLDDDDAAAAALGAIGRHLADDGTAIVPLFVPSPTAADLFGVRRTALLADGGHIAVSAIAETVDHSIRSIVTTLRYERVVAGGKKEEAEVPWLRHWYTQAGFLALAESAGLSATLRRTLGGPSAPDDDEWVAVLRPG